MPIYQYLAKDKNGSTLKGELDCASEAEAAEALHKKELVIVSLASAEPKKAVFSFSLGGKKVKADDMVIFSRQLATMIDAGIPLTQALAILSEQIESPALKQIVIQLHRDIEGGMNFCDALSKHPSAFSELFINMARAGEASGMLNEILDRVASYLEKSAALARKIRSSLVYPAVVVSMAILITGFLMVKVVPTFAKIFDMLGGQLPLPTRILIMLSNMIRHYLLAVTLITVACGFALKKYIWTEKGRYNFDTFKLKMPVLGQLFHKVALAKFARTFSTLVKSGVPILKGLDIVARTSGNKMVERAVVDSRQAVRDGEPLSQPLAKSGIFPSMVCRMINIGEQTGQLEKMLSKIADFYDDQVDAAVSALTSLIEPLVIAFLGIVVGGIVISLFLPIFKITELISK